jgi:ATP/maltotriose-dependent transcriptional regulator MalT
MERLELEPLDLPELAELVRNISGEEMAPSTLARLHERSDGNPFFVEELLASGAGASSPMHSSLRELLLSRVDTVDAPQRRLLETAAIGGRAVDHDVLVTVSGEAEAQESGSLRGLVELGLLTVLSMPDRDVYEFRHALLQEAVHDAIPVAEHRRLHRAFAEELERRDSEAAGDASLLVELAHHWREARDPRALQASIRAGDAAVAGFSFDIALNEYERALLRWDPSAAEVDHVTLLERTARAAYLSSHYERAVTVSREAIEELGEADGARRCELQVLQARVLWLSDWGAAVPVYEQALECAPSDPPVPRIRAQAGLAQAYMLQGQYQRARRICQDVIERARAIGARDLEGHGLNTLGMALAGVGEVDAAIEAIDAALAIAVELDIPDDIGRAYVNRADILGESGYPERACRAAEAVEAVDRAGMAASYGVYLRFGLVDYAFRAGDWQLAADLLDEADRIMPDVEGTRLYRAIYVLDYLVCSGHEEASDLWSWTRSILADRSPYSRASYAYLGGVELAALSGRPEDAVETAWEGLDLVAPQESWVDAADLARVAAWPVADVGSRARAAGDGEGLRMANERMDRLTEVVRASRYRLGNPTGRLGELLDLDDAQVEAERRRMETSPDAASWHRIAIGWSDVHQPYRALLARWREAEAAEALGERPPAVSLLREAYGSATRLGAEPLASLMESLARKMRIRLDATSVASEGSAPVAYGLTPREREVLSLVVAGMTNRQIAEELYITESTAGVHVSHILSKFGVASRAEAVRVALSQDLVELEGGR